MTFLGLLGWLGARQIFRKKAANGSEVADKIAGVRDGAPDASVPAPARSGDLGPADTHPGLTETTVALTYVDIDKDWKDFAAAVATLAQAHADVVAKGAKLQADLAALLGTSALDPATAATLQKQETKIQEDTAALKAAVDANQPK